MHWLRGNGRYANVTATLALIVATGGTSVAAVSMAKNSVGTPQLKADAVTGAKVKNGTLLKDDFKAGQLPAGPAGAAGAAGPAGAAGAAGATGATGPAGPFLTVLGSGQTLRGYIKPWGEGTTSNLLATTTEAFAFPLSVAPTAHFIAAGAPNPTGCTGTSAAPAANPGHLCVYESTRTNGGPAGINGPAGDNSASRFGFSAWLRSAASGQFSYEATWAVTAA